MRARRRVSGLWFAAILVLVSLTGSPIPMRAESSAADIEPNDTCAAAQELGALDIPLTLAGSLDGLPPDDPEPNPPNLDFFRLSAAPGSRIQIELAGASSGLGTLENPLLGVLPSSCESLMTQIFDGTGPGFDERAVVTVPPDGVVVVAVTSCCDYGLYSGGLGGGSYTLTVRAPQTIGTISGRLLNAETLQPVEGATVSLMRCGSTGCLGVAWQVTGATGAFSFSADDAGHPLPIGVYQMMVNTPGYQIGYIEVGELQEGQSRALGDVSLTPLVVVRSIGGRIIDAATGQPPSLELMAGLNINLLRCDMYGCNEYIANTLPDVDGRFRFVDQSYVGGIPLTPGNYAIEVAALYYFNTRVEGIVAEQDQDVDVGDIALTRPETARSISGRIVDALTGRPPDAETLEWARVMLYRCGTYGCYDYAGSVAPEADGEFRFIDGQGAQLITGDYAIEVQAPQYNSARREGISAGRDEDLYIGDVAITSFPVRFYDVQGCDSILADGETCRYSVRIINAQSVTLSGQAWSVVTAAGFGPQSGMSVFQNGGAERIRLRPGRSAQLSFRLKLPATVPPGAAFCAYVYVGDDPRSQFSTVGNILVYCATRFPDGTVQQLSPEQSLELIQRMNGLPAGRSAPR